MTDRRDPMYADENLLEIPRNSRGFVAGVIIAAVVFVVLGGVALLLLPRVLLVEWLPSLDDEGRRQSLGAAAQIVLFSLGGLIAIAGVMLSVLRHRQELHAAERDRRRHNLELRRREDELGRDRSRQDDLKEERRIAAERELRGRFMAPVDMLSSDSSIKRVAALYALASLADDWAGFGRADETQVCIDVICGYLRTPSVAMNGTPPEEVTVRQTGFALIRDHLLAESPHPWQDKTFDLKGIRLDYNLDLARVTLRPGGQLIFDNAILGEGQQLRLSGAQIDGGRISLRGARFRKKAQLAARGLTMIDATFGATAIVLGEGASIGMHRVRAVRSTVDFNFMKLGVSATVDLSRGGFEGAELRLVRLGLEGSSSLRLPWARVDDSHIDLGFSTISETASVLLGGLVLEDGGDVTIGRLQINEDGQFLDGGSLTPDGPVRLPDGQRWFPDTAR